MTLETRRSERHSRNPSRICGGSKRSSARPRRGAGKPQARDRSYIERAMCLWPETTSRQAGADQLFPDRAQTTAPAHGPGRLNDGTAPFCPCRSPARPCTGCGIYIGAEYCPHYARHPFRTDCRGGTRVGCARDIVYRRARQMYTARHLAPKRDVSPRQRCHAHPVTGRRLRHSFSGSSFCRNASLRADRAFRSRPRR